MPSTLPGSRVISGRGKGQYPSCPGGFTFRREVKHQKLKYKTIGGVEWNPRSEPTKKLKDPHVEIKTSHLKLTGLNGEPIFR